jgi:TolB-like protein
MRPPRRLVPPLLVLVCGLVLGPAHVAVQPAAAAGEMRVAVLEFTSASQDAELASLGKGLQSMVTTDLANVATIKVVERERLKDVQGELKLASGAGFDKSTAAKIGKLAGATHLFVGSFTVVGDKMRLDGRLLVVATGEIAIAEQIAGDKAYFFELEQKLVEKVIAILGVKPAPKEKAALARPHTADFGAFKKFSEGLQAFDDGRLEDAMKSLSEATAIDKDFKLATLTLEEYERLAAQVRAKAEAAGHVEDEVARLEKHKAIAGAVGAMKQLWPLVDRKASSPDAKLLRVAATCVLANLYRNDLGYKNRGPLNAEDLARAGFDDFTLQRTADALLARAWAEAADVFPRVPPLCIGFGMIYGDRPDPIEKLLGYEIDRAAKLAADTDALLSHMSNNSRVDPAAAQLHLDAPGEVKLWESLYALAQRLPKMTDRDRARYEETIAEHRREIADFDGSAQMYAAAARHTKDSHKLKEYAKEIETNKELAVAYKAAPPLAQELYKLTGRAVDARLAADPKRLARELESAREVREHHGRSGAGGYIFLGDLPLWRMLGRTMYPRIRTGPRTTKLRTAELRYEIAADRDGKRPPEPVVFASPMRGKRFTIKAQIDASAPPPEWRPGDRNPPTGGGEAGVAFALSRMTPEGGIERGAPIVTIGYAVLVAADRARLVQITRDGEHRVEVKQLADASVGAGRGGPRALEVTVEPGKVAASVDGKRVAFPWKPERDADGFLGVIFNGPGYASLSRAAITVK